MLLCKPDSKSLTVMAKCLESFSQSSGLFANSSKSTIYIAGVNQELKDSLARTINLPIGLLPFRYLGVPLTAKRIFIRDCDQLVDTMTRRIRSWHAKHLSYAARLQLINFVLMNISIYWCQIFMLPKKVIHHINTVCRSFLWFGIGDNGKPGNVNWEKVCTPKKYGGCSFSSQCVEELKRWLQLRFQIRSIASISDRRWKIPRFQKKLLFAALAYIIYRIWCTRNEAVLQGYVEHLY